LRAAVLVASATLAACRLASPTSPVPGLPGVLAPWPTTSLSLNYRSHQRRGGGRWAVYPIARPMPSAMIAVVCGFSSMNFATTS
jgi:hypothetical protein